MAPVSGAAEAGFASAAGPPRVYRFTDDALDDAVALLAALGQHGIVPVGATAILKAKRTLGSDDWDHEAELDFWHAYAGLAACFRTDPALAPVLTDFLAAHRMPPVWRDVFSWPWRYLVRILFLVAFVVVLTHWIDGKILADRLDDAQIGLISCLSPVPRVGRAVDEPPAHAAMTLCDDQLKIVHGLLARAEDNTRFLCVWGLLCAPGTTPGRDPELLWQAHQRMALERTPEKPRQALDEAIALGQHVQAVAVYVLPMLFGALGAYVSSIYRQLGRPWLEVSPNRVTLRRRIILVFCGAVFGGMIGWLMSQVSMVPSLAQSFGPLLGAFAAGFNTRPVVKFVSALADRVGDWAERVVAPPHDREHTPHRSPAIASADDPRAAAAGAPSGAAARPETRPTIVSTGS